MKRVADDDTWVPSGIPDLPWHPEWTVQASCRGQYGVPESPDDEQYDPFFDYSAEDEYTKAAKRLCYGCPVRLECLRHNLYVPFGVFGGYTDKERRKLRNDNRSRDLQVSFFREAG